MEPHELALSTALNQTGFPFEHHVYQAVVGYGWNARSSRLYIDAQEKKVREMDLLCYRISKGREVTTCTALLISCKRRTEKPWVLLTRRWPDRDRGWTVYPPVAVCTNSTALNWEVQRSAWARDYFNLAEASGLKAWSADSEREVFALQEFEAVKATGAQPRFAARGDSGLYEGAMTLLKALAYETTAVRERRGAAKEQFVYQFNLVQLIDGDLFEANFDLIPPEVKRVSRYRYFARTMLEGKDFSARIEFCTREALVPLLNELSKLHEFNCGHFDDRIEDFYQKALLTGERRDALLPAFEKRLKPLFQLFSGDEEEGEGWVRLEVPASMQPLKVLLLAKESAVAKAASEAGFVRFVKKLLKEVFRYQGHFVIAADNEPPF